MAPIFWEADKVALDVLEAAVLASVPVAAVASANPIVPAFRTAELVAGPVSVFINPRPAVIEDLTIVRLAATVGPTPSAIEAGATNGVSFVVRSPGPGAFAVCVVPHQINGISNNAGLFPLGSPYIIGFPAAY